MYVYMCTCKRMSCIYSMSCKYLHGAQRLRSGCKSWQRLQNGACCRWTTCLSLVHPLKFHHHLGPHVHQPRFPPRIVRHETKESVKTEGSLGEKYFFGGKNRHFEPKGVDLYSPRGVTMGKGREWKLQERNDSRNHSWKYSRELWEVTSLALGRGSIGAQ